MMKPSENRVCSSSQDQSGEPTAMRRIPIRKENSIPDVCCECGVVTRRRVKIQFKKHPLKTENVEGLLSGILSPVIGFLTIPVLVIVDLFRGLLGVAIKATSRKNFKVLARICQCRDCAKKNGRPYPHHISFERNKLEFVVHPGFAKEFARLNPQFDAESDARS